MKKSNNIENRTRFISGMLVLFITMLSMNGYVRVYAELDDVFAGAFVENGSMNWISEDGKVKPAELAEGYHVLPKNPELAMDIFNYISLSVCRTQPAVPKLGVRSLPS